VRVVGDWCRSWSRDKRAIHTESDTEVEYRPRLDVGSASPSARSEVTQGRSRTLQRPPATTATTATAGGGGRYGDDVDAELRHQYHRRQTSLPHTTTSGLFTSSTLRQVSK